MRCLHLLSGAVVLGATAATLIAVPTIAAAAPAAPPAPIGAPMILPPDPVTDSAPSPVAGYSPPLGTTAQTVASRIRVAAVSCTGATGQIFVVVGLGSTKTTGFVGVLLQTGCRNGQPYYLTAPIDQAGAVGPQLTVAAGDLLSMRASAGTSPKATVTDVTANTTSSGGTATFNANRAQFTVQAASSPFPTFTTYQFTRPTVGRTALSTLPKRRVNQVSSAGVVQLRTSAFTPSSSFTVRYVSQG